MHYDSQIHVSRLSRSFKFQIHILNCLFTTSTWMPNKYLIPYPKLTLSSSPHTYSSQRLPHLKKQQLHNPYPIPQQIPVAPSSKYSQFLRFWPLYNTAPLPMEPELLSRHTISMIARASKEVSWLLSSLSRGLSWAQQPWAPYQNPAMWTILLRCISWTTLCCHGVPFLLLLLLFFFLMYKENPLL